MKNLKAHYNILVVKTGADWFTIDLDGDQVSCSSKAEALATALRIAKKTKRPNATIGVKVV